MSASISRGWTSRSSPGDDFYNYADGTWMQGHAEIPADRSSIGGFFIADQEREKNTRELFDGILKANPTSGNDALIANYYNAYLNTDAIDRAGLAPAKADLDAIARIADKRALSAAIGGTLRADTDPLNATNFQTENLFGIFVTQGAGDARRAAALSDAGRHRAARARILSVRRPEDGRDPDQV